MKRAWFIVGVLLLAGCGASQRNADTAEVLGTPPSPEEDPFFYVARPPVDAKADSKGTIGDAPKKRKGAKSTEKKSGRKSEDLGRLAELERKNLDLKAENLNLRSELDESEAAASDLRAKNRALKRELAGKEAPAVAARSASKLAQCHACVKLCPLKGRCADDAELVCGWGTGKSTKEAKRRARAECDGALASLQKRGAFSRIEGKCPVAVCR